jgi:PBP1b-binding outer membrane lipoprotein LpoB
LKKLSFKKRLKKTNSFGKLFALFFLIVCFGNCSKSADEQTEFEKRFAAKIKAKMVDISHKDVTKTSDGVIDSHETYISVEVTNSKEFERIKHNQRVLNNVCEELASYIIDSIEFEEELYFNQVKFEFVESRDLLVFHQKKSTIVDVWLKEE